MLSVQIKVWKQTGVSINPNPFTSNIIVSIHSKQNTKTQVVIYNAIGVKVKEQSGITLSKGFNKIPFNAADFSQGFYILEINIDNVKTVKKVVKLKKIA